MQVKVALQRYILEKSRKNEVIHLTKVKHQLGKVDFTIGRGEAPNTYSIWQYSKECRCGDKVIESSTPFSLANYLQDFCGNSHLKKNLPLHKYSY